MMVASVRNAMQANAIRDVAKVHGISVLRGPIIPVTIFGTYKMPLVTVEAWEPQNPGPWTYYATKKSPRIKNG